MSAWKAIVAAASGAGLAAVFLVPDLDWSTPPAAIAPQGDATTVPPRTATATRGDHDGPTSPATLADLQAAQRHSAELAREVARRRADLSARVGPRGAVVGRFTGPDGCQVPLHAANVEQARKLFRRLPPELQPNRPAAVEAVRLGCARWDAYAEREGLLELQHRAEAARRYADGLLRQVAVAAVA